MMQVISVIVDFKITNFVAVINTYWRETSTVEGPQNILLSRGLNEYFIIYQESKKRKNKANFMRKYMKYFINFLKKRLI